MKEPPSLRLDISTAREKHLQSTSKLIFFSAASPPNLSITLRKALNTHLAFFHENNDSAIRDPFSKSFTTFNLPKEKNASESPNVFVTYAYGLYLGAMRLEVLNFTWGSGQNSPTSARFPFLSTTNAEDIPSTTPNNVLR